MGFYARQMDFADKWAAIVWMCRNQLGRRNLTDVQRTLLIGEAYRAQRMTVGNHAEKTRNEDGRFSVFRQDDGIRKKSGTARQVAKTFGVGYATVERANKFFEGLETADAVSTHCRGAVKRRRALSCSRTKDKNKWAILTHLFCTIWQKAGGSFPYPSPCPSEAAGAPLSRSIVSVIARLIKPFTLSLRASAWVMINKKDRRHHSKRRPSILQ